MILRHALLRLRTAGTQPDRLALLVGCAATTLLLWPDPTDPSGSGWPGGRLAEEQGALVASLISLLWMVLWPALATGAVRGTAAGGRRDPSYALQAHPALPLTPRGRTVAEALVVLAAVVLFRVAGAFVGAQFGVISNGAGGGIPFIASYLGQTVAGGLAMLPVLLLSGVASRSIESYWLRSWAAVGIVLAAMKLGLFQTLTAGAVTSAALSAAVLMLMGRESAVRFRRPRSTLCVRRGARALFRPFGSPEARFRRDLWTRPLPVTAALLAVEGAALLADRTIGLPPFGFLAVSVLVFSWLIAMVTLQPMRSRLAVAGIFGKPGFEAGDFGAAWGVLPLRPRTIARELFVYGLVTAACIWSAAAGTILFSSWLETGRAALVGPDGEPLGPIFLPTLAMVPAVAAFLTCAALGDRRGAYLSGAILVAIAPLATLMLVGNASDATRVTVALVLAAASVAQAVEHLRSGSG